MLKLEQFLCARAGFIQHPPQRLLPQMNVAAGDEPVDRGPRAHRCLGVRQGRSRGRRRDLRGVPALLAAPGQPFRDRGAPRVPGVDRRVAPERFEGCADLAVGDRVQGPAGAGQSLGVAAVERIDGLDDRDAVDAAGVARPDGVQERFGRSAQSAGRGGGVDPACCDGVAAGRIRGYPG